MAVSAAELWWSAAKVPSGMPNNKANRNGHDAKLQSHRKTLADQFGDGEILVLERGAEISVQERTEVASVLSPNRLIQAIGALQIRLDFRRQRLLLIEGTAGRGAHQKKCDGDDNEQRGNSAGKSRKEVARHLCRSLLTDREVDKRSIAP